MPLPDLSKLPRPFRDDGFSLLRRGIHDDPDVAVHINERRDFAFLNPLAATDYSRYSPRVARLGLKDYKARGGTSALRYDKISTQLAGAGTLLEIGAGDAAFLAHIHDRHPTLSLACMEPDAKTRPLRDQLSWLTQYRDFAAAGDRRFDVVCLFHVLEHILDPLPFLRSCFSLLATGGRLIIEVPSLDDPLVSLYELPAYADFFYQKQHPYYYSAASLGRLLDALGSRLEAMIPHQRYGLENHLNWLRNGVPGGDAALRTIFAGTDASYRKSLEDSGRADAVITVATQ